MTIPRSLAGDEMAGRPGLWRLDAVLSFAENPAAGVF